ncbi:hypothetical protein WA026_017772 [Henosepilachna vigintioctopunctata]|uniref:Uncharacterized protein n=1 Tax=Henosepilachna vigintioctopunctata TaxID=420089 RepID=A0AAW1U9V0_9CUCU
MGVEENNPYGIHVGMEISVGAMPPQTSKIKKLKNEDLHLGSSECFHGIPPQGRFMDEIYFDQWKMKQIKYKTRLSHIKRKRVERTKGEFDHEHNYLLSLCGPEWYQELSPNQKETVDQLCNAISKDLSSHLTNSTQSSLSLLGMRPLPNDKQLWKALIKSYGCPIEFLLTLYDLMKPQRNHYSMNDRLLLSGVAHLSLRHTLKEMHVRFPSPPRSEPKSVPAKPKPPKKKYPHVYLIPFTFKWPIRNRDVYKNPVVQKPDCPYFSYVCELIKERVISIDDCVVPVREDENIKIPCELFDDHLKAEELYNSVFKRKDQCKYLIMRPRNYESCTPKRYPGILPQYMLKKKYPLALKLFFDIKIYDEIDSKTEKTRKVVRTICEVKKIPVGRPGQILAQTLIAKFIYIKNIGKYIVDNTDPTIVEDQSQQFFDHPCSVCGGPDRKLPASEMKPLKVKKYIKQIKKPKEKRVYRDWSPSESLDTTKVKKEVVHLNEETMKLKLENKTYFDAWRNFFINIDRLEKLRLETKECVCPDRTRDKSKTDPENDCTCAIWNIPSPPPPAVPSKISCECKPQIEEPPEDDKCDCKQKAREKAAEACGHCGVVKMKPNNNTDEHSACDCVKKQSGNCVEQNADYNQEFTVGYVFASNQPPNGETSKPKKKVLRESIGKCTTCKKHLKTDAYLKSKQKDNKNASDISQNCGNEMNEKERNRKESCGLNDEAQATEKQCDEVRENLMIRENYLKLDHCRRETQKLLKLLKCDCSKCKDLRKKYRSKYIQAGNRDACGGMIPVIGGTFGSNNECDCLEKFEERVKGVDDYQKRMKAKLHLKSEEYKYIISGVTQTIRGPIYNISGIIPNKPKPPPCICDTTEEEEAESKRRDMLLEKIEDGYKYIISGVKQDARVNEYIFGGRIKECQCSEVFAQFMEEHNECLVNYENYLKYMKKEITEYTKEMNEKYSQLPLSAQKLLDEEVRRLKGPPGLPVPGGKSEFVVSGVKTNDFKKSFVLGGVLLREKKSEECVIAVQSYTSSTDEKGISKCQRTYLCNYMTFGKNCGNPFRTTANDLENKDSSEELICQCISYETVQGGSTLEEDETEKIDEEFGPCGCETPCGAPLKQLDECSCNGDELEEDHFSCDCLFLSNDESENEPIEGCTCAEKEKDSETPSNPCMCGVKNCGCQIDTVCVKECFYGPMEAWWSDTDIGKKSKKDMKKRKIRTSLTRVGGSSERYVILEEIPKNKKDQEDILKKLLHGLANDGYPLANLPDCHKIPYFWLWLQFRMKKQWGYEDGVKNFKRSQRLWNHISVCRRTIPLPKLPAHCKTQKYTWKDAEFVAKMIGDIKQKYYNRLRKSQVDFAREFYITLSPYQFPRPPYLNHYFYAYQPSKLENAITEFMWQPEECKDPRHRKSCFCK